MSLDNRPNVTPDATRESVKPDEDLSLINILNVFLRERWLILGIAGLMALVALVSMLFAPRKYTVETSFIVQKRDQPAVAGIAAQLGMDLNGADASQSPAFYAGLVKTPDVLDRLVDSTFTTSTNPKPRTLATIWNIEGGTPNERREEVIEKLQDMVSSSVSLKLDLVVLQVVTHDPELSKELADAIVRQVNWFNLSTRQSRAAAERQFAERLVAEVGTDLRGAEDEAQQFFQRNQQSHLSAALEMERQRLARRLEILNARYVSVVTAYDRARIDEVRDTPVITVIQRPKVPVRPDSRNPAKKTVLWFLLGLGLGSIVAIARQVFSNLRASRDGDAQEFHHLLGETSGDVRKLWSKVGQRARKKRIAKLSQG